MPGAPVTARGAVICAQRAAVSECLDDPLGKPEVWVLDLQEEMLAWLRDPVALSCVSGKSPAAARSSPRRLLLTCASATDCG